MENRCRLIPLMFIKYVTVSFLLTLWWCGPLSAEQLKDETKSQSLFDKEVAKLEEDARALDGLRKKIRAAAAEASSAATSVASTRRSIALAMTEIGRLKLPGDPVEDCRVTIPGIRDKMAYLAAEAQKNAADLDSAYDNAAQIVKQCASKSDVGGAIQWMDERGRSLKKRVMEWNIAMGKQKDRLDHTLTRMKQARQTLADIHAKTVAIVVLAKTGHNSATGAHTAAAHAEQLADEFDKKTAGIRERVEMLRKSFSDIASYVEPRLESLETMIATGPVFAAARNARASGTEAQANDASINISEAEAARNGMAAESLLAIQCDNISAQDDADTSAAGALVYMEMLDGQVERIREDAAVCLAELGRKAPPQPDRVALVAAADCSMYPGSQAYWDENANKPLCGCPDGRQWNMEKTACVAKDLVDWVKELSGDVVGGASDSEGITQKEAEAVDSVGGTTRKEAGANTGGEGSRNELDSLLDEVAANRGVGTDARRGKQEMERQQREKSQYIESGPASSQQYQGTFGGGSADNLGEKIGKAFTDILEANRKNDEERRKIEEDWQRQREQSRDAAARRQAERTREKPQSAQEGGSSASPEAAPSSEGRHAVILCSAFASSNWRSMLPECNIWQTCGGNYLLDDDWNLKDMEKMLSELRTEGRKYEIRYFSSMQEAGKFKIEAGRRANAMFTDCFKAQERHNKTR